MNLSLITKGMMAAGILSASALFGVACSDDPETGDPTGTGGSGGGAGGQGGEASSSTGMAQGGAGGGQGGAGGQGGGAGGAGGQGGAGCGDTQTNPMNCGSCGNACAPGQTCEAGSCMCGVGATATLADVQAIFSKSCGSAGFCHNKTMNPAAGLDLRPGMAYADLVNVDTSYCKDGRKRVVPGQPSESYLIDKVTNMQLCDLPNGMKSGKMPPGTNLPAGDIQTLTNWICGGAQP